MLLKAHVLARPAATRQKGVRPFKELQLAFKPDFSIASFEQDSV
jgi:hypothetical protein